MKLKKGMICWYADFKNNVVKEVTIENKFQGISPAHYFTSDKEVVDSQFCFPTKEKAELACNKYHAVYKFSQQILNKGRNTN